MDLIILAHSLIVERKTFLFMWCQKSFHTSKIWKEKKNKLQNNVSYSLVCAQCLAQRTRWRNTKQLRIVTSGERRGKLEEWQIGEGRHSCFFFFSKYFSVVWIFYNNNIFTCDLCDFKRTIKDSFSQWEMVLFIYNA